MRIDKIEIDGFGKLNNFSLSLDSGFNLILGENESGKSTLCAFLLSVFYDMPNDGKRLELSESLRRKYKPWNGERFGGRVYFTHAGRQYILEKTFGATKRSDRARLLDAATWDECGSAENAGERFFGLGREGFLKTLYITGLAADGAEMGSEEILTRLSNLETSGDEDISYQSIQNALEKEQFAILTKTGKGGRLAALRDEEIELQTEFHSAVRFYDGIKEDERRAGELKTQIAAAQTALNTAEEAYQTALAHESYLTQKKAEETRAVLSARLSTENDRLLQLQQKLSALSEKLREAVRQEDTDKAKDLERQLIILENKKEEAQKRRQEQFGQIQQNAAKRKRTGMLVSAVVFVFFVIAGIALKSFVRPLAFVLPAAGLALAVLIFFLLGKRTGSGEETEFLDKELTGIDSRLTEIQTEISALCRKYGTNGLQEIFARAAEESGAKTARQETEAQAANCEAEIKSLTESLLRLPKEKAEPFSENAVNYAGAPAPMLAEQIKQLKEKLEGLNREHYDLSVALAKQTADSRSIADIKSDLLAVSGQIDLLTKRHAALLKASEWLARAHGEIKQNYAPRLNKKTAEIFSRLTSEKYSGVKLGEGFRLNYQNENNEIVDAMFLSGGTYDLLYIALRFASLSVLFGGEIPPVISDDALLQLDDDRLRAAVDFMANSGTFGQVIYFTCHKTSAGLFEQKHINRIEI